MPKPESKIEAGTGRRSGTEREKYGGQDFAKRRRDLNVSRCLEGRVKYLSRCVHNYNLAKTQFEQKYGVAVHIVVVHAFRCWKKDCKDPTST